MSTLRGVATVTLRAGSQNLLVSLEINGKMRCLNRKANEPATKLLERIAITFAKAGAKQKKKRKSQSLVLPDVQLHCSHGQLVDPRLLTSAEALVSGTLASDIILVGSQWRAPIVCVALQRRPGALKHDAAAGRVAVAAGQQARHHSR